jgi:hypothetical protein
VPPSNFHQPFIKAKIREGNQEVLFAWYYQCGSIFVAARNKAAFLKFAAFQRKKECIPNILHDRL